MTDGEPKRQRFEVIDDDDVITEILLRLPVESLIRFQCVCKSWRAIISDEFFVAKHLRRVVTGLNRTRFNLILGRGPHMSIEYGKSLNCFGVSGDTNSKYIKFHYPVAVFRDLGELIHLSDVDVSSLEFPESMKKKPKRFIQIYGAWNGLVCLEFDGVGVMIWNPYTGECRMLPKSVVCGNGSASMYGFGYDSVNDDYKVVRGRLIYRDGITGCAVEVFTMKTGVWRECCFSDELRLMGQGCFANGALHWVKLQWDDSVQIKSSVIVSFDMEEEKIRENVVECPDPLAGSDECYFSVEMGVVGDCLCVCLQQSDSDLSIWIMKEYGVKESWTEVVKIPREALPKGYESRPRYELRPRPLDILESGEVLMNFDRNVLALYSPKKKMFNAVLVIHENIGIETTTYVQSLVSPETGRGTELTWEQRFMGMDRPTNSFRLLLPNCPLHSVDYKSLLEYLKEVDVNLTTEKFDYPVLIQEIWELILGQFATRTLEFPFMIPRSDVQIYGSCNGLICVEIDYHNIIMWNPCIRNAKLLPGASHFYDNRSARFYGFGYDSTKKDYKVIRGCYSGDPAISTDEARYEVYTLKTGSWRQYINHSIHVLGQGCLVNESLHWIDHENDLVRYKVDPKILSFSLDEEIFKEVEPFPNPPAGNLYKSVEVGAIGGCLCVCFEPVDSDLRIWMMKQYGVKESWTEVIKVPQEFLPVKFPLNFRPLCILDNGEILLYLQRNLVLYSPKGHTFRTLFETHGSLLLNKTIYVETLVSPDRQ